MTEITKVSVVREAVSGGPPILGPESVASFAREVLGDEEREHLLAFYLNGAHEVTDYYVVSIGSVNECAAQPREVFRPAIAVGAVRIILAHNHPSGRVSPSPADRALTRRIAQAGGILGIELLDHVIVGRDHVYSIGENYPGDVGGAAA